MAIKDTKDKRVKELALQYLKDGVPYRDIIQLIKEECGESLAIGTLTLWSKERPAPDELIPERKAVNWREAIKIAKEMQSLNSTIEYSEYLFEAKIVTNEPVIIAMISDPHFGSINMDYDMFKNDVDLINSTRNAFLIWGNDDVDNFPKSFKSGKAIASQVFNPHQQKVLMGSLMNELVKNKKILAFVPGNHNDFSDRDSFDDIEWWRHQHGNYAYMPDGGLIKLTVGKQEYSFLIKHKYSGSSGKNKLNSNKTMLEKLYPLADFTLQGDKHDPALELEWRYEYDAQRQVVHLRAGTYKTKGDEYSRKFFKEGVSGVPCLVLFPNTKHSVPFLSMQSIKDAITFCNGLKGAKPR